MKTLSVADVAKDLEGCLDRVRLCHESFELVKGGIAYAWLVPPTAGPCDTHELADDLGQSSLSSEDKRTWGTAIREGRKKLKPLKNTWG